MSPVERACPACGRYPTQGHVAGCPAVPPPTCPACDAILVWQRAHYSCPQCHMIVLACCDGERSAR